jgi:hypothetical protein
MKGPSRWVGRTSRAKWLAVAVLVLAVLALAVSGCSDEDVSVSETSLAPPDPRHASTFVPRTETQDGRTLLPLVFPDGMRVVASYPRRLRLSRLGIQPDVSYYKPPQPRSPLRPHVRPRPGGAGHRRIRAPHPLVDDPRPR